MRVLFYFLVPPRRFVPYGFPTGLATLCALLKQQGHQARTIHLEKIDQRAIDDQLADYQPDLVGVSSTSDQFPLARRLVPYISGRHQLPVVLGGVHATVAPEESITVPGLLGICVGEGERSTLELVKRLARGEAPFDIQGFWFVRDGQVIKNPLGPLVADLDTLPLPDRECCDYQSIIDASYTDGASVVFSRGCPYACTFCINRSLQRASRGRGKYVRYRSVGHVMREIAEITQRFTNIRRISFHGEIFTMDKDWLAEFAERYPEVTAVPFRCNLRADRADRRSLQLLKDAGCEEIWFGVECGNERFRNEVLKKRLSNADIRAAFARCRELGIRTKALNMLGLPGETGELIEETIRFNRELRPDVHQMSIFRPYPGTALYDLCVERGWISDRQVAGFYEESIIDQPGLPGRETYFYQLLYYYGMILPRLVPLMKLLNRVPAGRDVSLFRRLHSKRLMYGAFQLAKRVGLNR